MGRFFEKVGMIILECMTDLLLLLSAFFVLIGVGAFT